MEIIIGRQGNQKTPISDQTVSRQHCKVTDNGDGTYTIENLSPSGTKVDGVDILRTTAKLNSRIQLGQSFSATLVELIGVPSASPSPKPYAEPKRSSSSSKPQPKDQPVKTFNISHLKQIWEDFNNTNIEMQETQRKTNLARTGFGIFTMCAMPMIFFVGPIGYALTGIGIIGNIYSFVGMKNAETAEERQRRQDEFYESWVCPNPECRHSLNSRNYKMLVRDYKYCPFCKCKYIEK